MIIAKTGPVKIALVLEAVIPVAVIPETTVRESHRTAMIKTKSSELRGVVQVATLYESQVYSCDI